MDFVSNFKLYQYDKAGNLSKPKDIVAASNSRAILVSSKKHSINPVNEALIC